MKNFNYVFGPVPSRRLGQSLGVSPIPEKTCNYSCVYCQLGRTTKMTNKRSLFFPVADIVREVQEAIDDGISFDVISIVGEGEPTLYAGLGILIEEIGKLTEKPVAVITNAALFYDPDVRSECAKADIVLPSMDAYDRDSWKKLDRPWGRLDFDAVFEGLKIFSQEYSGQLWLELMLVDGINTSDQALDSLREMAAQIRYDRLYINTPVRPPAEDSVRPVSKELMQNAVHILGGTSLDFLAEGNFSSDISDTYEAVKSIIRRHPMNRFELEHFLTSRKSGPETQQTLFTRLSQDPQVTVTTYRTLATYRAN